MKKARVGDVEVVALVDAMQGYGAAQCYPNAPDVAERYREHLTPEGHIPLTFACFLLRAAGRTLLVDTGLGPESGGKLLEGMQAIGVSPPEVDTVLFTHLHGDHTGWNIDRQTSRPLFSKARYLVPKGDWEHYGSREKPPGSFMRDVKPLEALGCLDLIEGEHSLGPSMTTLRTPGHTPGHLSVVIQSAGERGLIIGDVLVSTLDILEPSLQSSFDWDHGIAFKTRTAMLDRLEREQPLVGASHLPGDGLGRLLVSDGKRSWQPL
jgi:glyoxylase-like metal-dependent hydrolase (beta-lactamase superfamily II)